MLIGFLKVTHRKLVTQGHNWNLMTPLPVLGEDHSLSLCISPRTFYWEIIYVGKIGQIPGQETAEAKGRILPGSHYMGVQAGTDTALFKVYLLLNFSPKCISYYLSLDALTFVSLKIISSEIWEEKKYDQQMIDQWVELAWNSLKYQNFNNSLTYPQIIFYRKALTVGSKGTSKELAVGMWWGGVGGGRVEHDNSTLDLKYFYSKTINSFHMFYLICLLGLSMVR